MSNDGHGRVQTEDAANGPNVDGGPVVLAAEEDVGCPVPERHDLEEVGRTGPLLRNMISADIRGTTAVDAHFFIV